LFHNNLAWVTGLMSSYQASKDNIYEHFESSKFLYSNIRDPVKLFTSF
jgi:hypothetical protein